MLLPHKRGRLSRVQTTRGFLEPNDGDIVHSRREKAVFQGEHAWPCKKRDIFHNREIPQRIHRGDGQIHHNIRKFRRQPAQFRKTPVEQFEVTYLDTLQVLGRQRDGRLDEHGELGPCHRQGKRRGDSSRGGHGLRPPYLQ